MAPPSVHRPFVRPRAADRRTLPVRPLVLAALALCAWAAPVRAQWPMGEGGFWVKLSGFHHETESQFRSDGTERDFLFAGAESVSSAIFLDVLYGVTDRLDVWGQVPYFDLSFDDVTQERDEAGIGDVRLMARYHLGSFRDGSIPVSLRVGAKAPILESPIDPEVIPVGEGQWDFDFWLETGVSFWPVPMYGTLWLGYRLRLENETLQRDPGDERLLLAELGGTVVGPLGAKVTLDVLDGTDGKAEGVEVVDDAREIVWLHPAVTYQLTGSLAVEGGVRLALRGQNHPAGNQFTVALFYRRDAPGG